MAKKPSSIAAEIRTAWHALYGWASRLPGVIPSLWASIRSLDQNFHNAFHERHPVVTRFLGGLLRNFYGLITAPAFGIFLAFVLVGLVISGVVTIIVSLSAWCAWLVSVLSIARWSVVNRLNILPRILVVLALAGVSAFAANRYVEWCMTKFAQSHPPVAQKEEAPKNNTDDLVYQRLKGLFQEELDKAAQNGKSKHIPSISTTIVIPPTSSGNLKQRANELGYKILTHLYRYGWNSEGFTPDPIDKERLEEQPHGQAIMPWVQERSDDFKGFYLKECIEVRDEFRAFHMEDEILDLILDHAGSEEGNLREPNHTLIPPQEQEMIAKKFIEFAARLPNY